MIKSLPTQVIFDKKEYADLLREIESKDKKIEELESEINIACSNIHNTFKVAPGELSKLFTEQVDITIGVIPDMDEKPIMKFKPRKS